jgi:expansin (peptidoglycan-binding protein)
MNRGNLGHVLVVSIAAALAACAANAPAGPPAPSANAPAPPAPPPVAEAAPVAPAAPAPVVSAEPAPIAVASASAAPPAPATALAGEGKGEATFYTTDNKGACSLNPPINKLILAASRDVYQNADACGTCLEVTGGAGTAIVQVMDICFSCPPGNLVISKPGFEAIVGKQSGKGPVSWKPVACPVEGKVAIRVKEGSTRDWTAVQIRDSKFAIKSVKIQRDGDSEWKDLARANDNYWSATKAGAGDGGFKLQITAVTGQTIEETVAKGWKGGKVYPGAGQF